jgi:hypothetical protein
MSKTALRKKGDIICVLFVGRVKDLGIGRCFFVDTINTSLLKEQIIRKI